MQTVVMISVKAWGVVQFGSRKKVSIIEMPELVMLNYDLLPMLTWIKNKLLLMDKKYY